MSTKQAIKSLNDRLYAAAERAGFRSALASMCVEVIYTSGSFQAIWDPEVLEGGDRVPDYAALARAEAWVAKATAT